MGSTLDFRRCPGACARATPIKSHIMLWVARYRHLMVSEGHVPVTVKLTLVA